MLLACLGNAFMGLFAKLLSLHMSTIEVVFFRNGLGALFIIYQIYSYNRSKNAKKESAKPGGRMLLLLFRGLIGTISLYFFFYNIANMPLGTAFVFHKTSPLFIALIAFFLLKERMKGFAVLGLLISFAGVLFLLSPSADIELKQLCFGLANGLLAAIALSSVRELSRFYSTQAIVLSFFGSGAIISALLMIFSEFVDAKTVQNYDFAFGIFVLPSGILWLYIALMAVFSIIFQVFMTKSFALASKTGVVAGISYIDVPASLILGLFLGDALPGLVLVIGALLVLAGSLLLSLNQK